MKKMLYMLSLLLVCQACKHVEAPDTSRQWEGKPRMTSYARFIVTVLPE